MKKLLYTLLFCWVSTAFAAANTLVIYNGSDYLPKQQVGRAKAQRCPTFPPPAAMHVGHMRARPTWLYLKQLLVTRNGTVLK